MKSNYEKVEIKRFKDLLLNLFENFIQDDGFICGGFARVCLEEGSFKECSDVDIYCKNIEAFERIKDRLLKGFYVEDRISDIAISFKNAFTGKYPLQLIKPLNQGYVHTSDENIQEVLNNFDFTIIRAGIYKLNQSLVALVDVDFFRDKNNLVIKNIHCPVAEVYRVSKYIQKGFKISVKEVIKILRDWEGRDDQYKTNLIEKLEKENPSQEDINELEKLLHID